MDVQTQIRKIKEFLEDFKIKKGYAEYASFFSVVSFCGLESNFIDDKRKGETKEKCNYDRRNFLLLTEIREGMEKKEKKERKEIIDNLFKIIKNRNDQILYITALNTREVRSQEIYEYLEIDDDDKEKTRKRIEQLKKKNLLKSSCKGLYQTEAEGISHLQQIIDNITYDILDKYREFVGNNEGNEKLEEIKIKFHSIFNKTYHQELADAISLGKKSITIDFSDFAKFDPELADLLLDDPEELLKAGEIAIEHFDFDKQKNFTIRLINLPQSQKVLLRNIRSEHLGKLLCFEGTVRQKSDVRPQVTSARFECPSCGNILPVLQLDKQFKEPSKCGCGRKGKFNQISKELIDAQSMKLEELSDDLSGAQPKRINIFLKNDLVSPMSEKITNPGCSIRVVGIVKECPIISRSGGKSTVFDLLIEANSIEPIEEDYSEIKITPEDIKEIKIMSKHPELFKNIIDSICPSIYGHKKIKEALVMQQFGGIRKIRKDGVTTRGDVHVLLVGDPGSGKSQMAKRIQRVAPKGRYVSGKGASGCGLTASVRKDDFLNDWALEGGALVLANKGTVCIDELDKMDPEDVKAMHEAMEQQTVSINKANIQATLRCETSVLAAANPKFGRFDCYKTIAEQIALPVTLINRFDLIFPVKDIPNEKKDDLLSDFILDSHSNIEIDDAPINTNILRKYIAYAKRTVNPKLTKEAKKEIKTYFMQMRQLEGNKTVPITPRQLEGLIRLSEANARLRLSDKINKEDAKRAVDLTHHCLKLIAFDEETQLFDIDRIATDTPSKDRNKIVIIEEIIRDLEKKVGKTIPIEDIDKAAQEKGFTEDEIKEILQKLQHSGDIFDCKPGFIQKI